MKSFKLLAATIGFSAGLTMSSALAQNNGTLLPIQITNASGNLADMNNAADGNPLTIWNSGGPAMQWIDIDLGSDRLFSKLRMLPAMDKTGDVYINIYGRTSAGAWHLFGNYSHILGDSEWVNFFSPIEVPVRYLVIQTTQSPGWVAWREFQVFDGGSMEDTCNPSFYHGMALYKVIKDGCGAGAQRYYFRNIFNLPIGSIVNTCTRANLFNIPRLNFKSEKWNSGLCYGYNNDMLTTLKYE